MAIRQDNSILISLNSIEQFSNRAEIRDFLLNQWIRESPHTKYKYFVETLASGNKIYLERPGRLNKGCDFVIYIENSIKYKNGNDKPPNYSFILDDLIIKRKVLNQADWDSLIDSINSIYTCEPYSNAVKHISHLPIIKGHSYELILKTIRWFFIEQDITYWSGQGRGMFLSAIQGI